jgi:hypothetical protein
MNDTGEGLPPTLPERGLNGSAAGKTPNWSLAWLDSRQGGGWQTRDLKRKPETRWLGGRWPINAKFGERGEPVGMANKGE